MNQTTDLFDVGQRTRIPRARQGSAALPLWDSVKQEAIDFAAKPAMMGATLLRDVLILPDTARLPPGSTVTVERRAARPWELHDLQPERQAVEVHPVGDTDGMAVIADVLWETLPYKQALANAALIVLAVNAHERLVENLQYVEWAAGIVGNCEIEEIQITVTGKALKDIRAALAAAGK